MIIQIDTASLDDLRKRIGSVKLHATLNKSIKKSILILEREAKIETPVDTGFLRNSYETSFEDLVGKLRNTRHYAPHVHFGHKQQVGRYVKAIGKRLVKPFVPGNPFLFRAGERAEPKILGIFDSDIDELLKSI